MESFRNYLKKYNFLIFSAPLRLCRKWFSSPAKAQGRKGNRKEFFGTAFGKILPFGAALLIFGSAAFAQKSAITFSDVSANAGLNVSHISTAENRYIIESMSGGAAVFDCDGDGFLDVATVNGSSVENFKKGGDSFITLYRQIDGAKTKTPKFENITDAANLTR